MNYFYAVTALLTLILNAILIYFLVFRYRNPKLNINKDGEEPLIKFKLDSFCNSENADTEILKE